MMNLTGDNISDSLPSESRVAHSLLFWCGDQSGGSSDGASPPLPPKAERDEIVAEIRSTAAELHGRDSDAPGMCLYDAVASLLVLWGRGYHNYAIQAGNAFWRVEQYTPEGMDPLMFGYQFDRQAALPYLAHGMMPEIHCWVGDPTTGIALDVTSRDQVSQARRTAGMEWDEAMIPPDYEWGKVDGLVGKYSPSRDAIMLTAIMLERAGLYDTARRQVAGRNTFAGTR